MYDHFGQISFVHIIGTFDFCTQNIFVVSNEKSCLTLISLKRIYSILLNMGGFKKSRTKFPQNLLLIHTNKALLMLDFPSTLTLFPCTCGINLSERLSFLSLKPLMVPHCPEDKVRTFHLPSLPSWIARFYSYCFSHPPQTQGYSITKTSHYDHYLSFKAKHKCCLIHRALLISSEQK